MIRVATSADDGVVLAMALRFLNESTYAHQVTKDRKHLEELIAWLRNEQLLLVGGSEASGIVGMLGMVLVPSLMSGDLLAYEAAWWIEPAHRRGTLAVRLWEAAERWALEQGARFVQMIQPFGADAVGDMYRRRGYSPLETTWQLRLQEA